MAGVYGESQRRWIHKRINFPQNTCGLPGLEVEPSFERLIQHGENIGSAID
jgi:hypothetical protein